jgi:hypothetical protein
MTHSNYRDHASRLGGGVSNEVREAKLEAGELVVIEKQSKISDVK